MERLSDEPNLTEMELASERLLADAVGKPPLAVMLGRLKPERPTPKVCPRCRRKVPVKARDRERTVEALGGPVTYRRNYHYCEVCRAGFYPVDRRLGVPEEGDLSSEMERRVLDFGVNGPFDQGAERWSVHYPQRPVSSNMLRGVVERVGVKCEAAEPLRLQQELLAPPAASAEVLVVATDGSMLPMRGEEPWKEAKVGVIFREENHLSHRETSRGQVSQARYVATMGGQPVFVRELEAALEVEGAANSKMVAWLGDGAPGNWSVAEELCPKAIQILDWHHAVEHAMDCGKALLGEESPLLPAWQRRIGQLLVADDMDALVEELMECAFPAGRAAWPAINALIAYFRTNQHRMRYGAFLHAGLPIGSGFVESAHRHVLQTRMKCAGQHWSQQRAGRMARLRAAYRTAGPSKFHGAIRAAAA